MSQVDPRFQQPKASNASIYNSISSKRLELDKHAIGTYRYPNNVGDSKSGLGHHIQFTIIEKKGVQFLTGAREVATEIDVDPIRNDLIDTLFKNRTDDKTKATIVNAKLTQGSTSLQTFPEKIQSIIHLYMPDRIGSAYETVYTLENLTLLRGIAIEDYKKILSGNKTIPLELVRVLGQKGALDLIDSALGVLGLKPNAEPTLESLTRQTVNPYMEFLFQGVGQRSFSFSFRFSPRSKEEADQTNLILREFKRAQLPEKTQDGRIRNYPDIVQVKYYYNNAVNQYLHNFMDCVITKLDINYAPDGTYVGIKPTPGDTMGSQPAHIELNMVLSETTTMNRNDLVERNL